MEETDKVLQDLVKPPARGAAIFVLLNMLERLQPAREAEPSLVVADSQRGKLAPMI